MPHSHHPYVDLTADPNERRKKAEARIGEAMKALREIREARKPAGVYFWRVEPDDPYEVVQVTETGEVLSMGSAAKTTSEEALEMMKSGQWLLILPPGEIVE